MLTEYTDVTEFKRLMEEKKIKPERVKTYLKTRGIVFTAANAGTFAEQVYTIFLGSKEMSEIADMMQSDANYEKSLMLKARTKRMLPHDEDVIDFFIDEFTRFYTSKTSYQFERPVRDENLNQFSVSLTYDKRLPGKNKLLQTEKRSITYFVRKIDDNEVIIDVRQQSSADTSEALKIIKQISGVDEESTFFLLHINLLSLPPKSSVSFFDKLMKRAFENWRLKTITGVTLKKADSIDDDDDEESISSDDDDTSSNDTLTGINQAALQGQGLQHNEFVKSTLNKGYLISSMRFRYSCKKEAEEFAVIVSCKGEDIKIDIDKTYCEEEGRIYVSPFSKERQHEIILEFQNAANEINNQLCRELSKVQNNLCV